MRGLLDWWDDWRIDIVKSLGIGLLVGGVMTCVLLVGCPAETSQGESMGGRDAYHATHIDVEREKAEDLQRSADALERIADALDRLAPMKAERET